MLEVFRWMGRFTNKNVVKCVDRMAVCFSSSYAIVDFPPKNADFKLEEIRRKEYDFSDGVSMISHDLVMKIPERLQLNVSPSDSILAQLQSLNGL